jgi:decaprenylphospho-beta-D-ribofuranose 2-oxidase
VDALTFDSLTRLDNFGHSLSSPAYTLRPEGGEQILDVFRLARRIGLTVTLRGAGRSYNDAALNGGGIVIDLQGMNRILDWDPQTGLIRAEPGVTLEQLWQCVLPDGWWPPVVSGTMFTTLGGCLGMNIHGKNNFRLGTIGEHVTGFTALLPTGAQVTCSPKKNGDLFHAMIGGLGMLGVFTSVTMQMKRVHSGYLQVRAWNVADLAGQLQALLEEAPEHDYIVGWLDAAAGGRGLGRGQMHSADALPEGADPQAEKTRQVAFQTVPANLFGVLPKAWLPFFMAPFLNNPGVRLVNTAKYLAGRDRTYRQPHAAFHFLLDYIPNWERAYGAGGLIQHQSFLPRETAREAWTEMLALSQRRRLPSYLGVTKRHRPDPFLLSHAVDGFSLALDFKVNAVSRPRLAAMLEDFDRIVLQAGGRFYFAKNSETRAETAARFLGSEAVERFKTIKQRCDPYHLLESDLYRRIFPSGDRPSGR